MPRAIKISAKHKGDVTTVKALISHPMETGNRKDKNTGQKVPAHFINQVKCEHKGKTVMNGYWSAGVSKNPYLSFRFKGGKPGDKIVLSWVDNKGGSDSKEAVIK